MEMSVRFVSRIGSGRRAIAIFGWRPLLLIFVFFVGLREISFEVFNLKERKK